MKKILVLLLLGISLSANAQRVDKPNEPYDVYCWIVYNGIRQEPARITTSIDYGKDNARDCFICDENDCKIIFNNVIDCINYMAKRGWQIVGNIGITENKMKKTVTSDKEAYANLNIKLDKDVKKK